MARADFPAGLREALARFIGDALVGIAAGAVGGQLQSIMPAHQTARLEQIGGAQPGFADQQTRAEPDATRELVRFGRERGAHLERGVTDAEHRTGRDVEPCQQGLIGRGAEAAVLFGESIRDRHGGLELHRAVQRVSAVHRLDLDQRGVAVVLAGHGAHRGGDRDAAAAGQKVPFGGLNFAVDQAERKVAAKNGAAFARQPVPEAAGQRADAGDGRDAERDAGDEDVKAAQATAQFAQGEPQGDRPAFVACRGGRDRAHVSIFPERIRTTRSQRAARFASCVTSTNVVPRSLCP